jgi:hypothetical protein
MHVAAVHSSYSTMLDCGASSWEAARYCSAAFVTAYTSNARTCISMPSVSVPSRL